MLTEPQVPSEATANGNALPASSRKAILQMEIQLLEEKRKNLQVECDLIRRESILLRKEHETIVPKTPQITGGTDNGATISALGNITLCESDENGISVSSKERDIVWEAGGWLEIPLTNIDGTPRHHIRELLKKISALFRHYDSVFQVSYNESGSHATVITTEDPTIIKCQKCVIKRDSQSSRVLLSHIKRFRTAFKYFNMNTKSLTSMALSYSWTESEIRRLYESNIPPENYHDFVAEFLKRKGYSHLDFNHPMKN